MIDSGCQGPGKCHGPQKWCDTCGDVDQTCDARLRGERCDAHPVPPTGAIIRAAILASQRKMAEGHRLVSEAAAELEEAHEEEGARRAYDLQLAAYERAVTP